MKTPSVDGHEHHLVMLRSAGCDGWADETHVLEAGDCLRYQLHVRLRFPNGDQPASYS